MILSNKPCSNYLFSEQQVVGWGRYEFGKISDKLRMVRMPVVPKDICLESDEKFYPIFTHKTSFCAGNRNGMFMVRQ